MIDVFAGVPRIDLGFTPTPLEPLDRLSELLGGPRIWIKRDDCTGLATGGNKTRKLEFLMGDAKAQRRGHRSDLRRRAVATTRGKPPPRARSSAWNVIWCSRAASTGGTRNTRPAATCYWIDCSAHTCTHRTRQRGNTVAHVDGRPVAQRTHLLRGAHRRFERNRRHGLHALRRRNCRTKRELGFRPGRDRARHFERRHPGRPRGRARRGEREDRRGRHQRLRHGPSRLERRIKRLLDETLDCAKLAPNARNRTAHRPRLPRRGLRHPDASNN